MTDTIEELDEDIQHIDNILSFYAHRHEKFIDLSSQEEFVKAFTYLKKVMIKLEAERKKRILGHNYPDTFYFSGSYTPPCGIFSTTGLSSTKYK